jgi:hypothetical protein
MKAIGIECETVARKTNPHAFSAACREAAVSSVFAFCAQGKRTMSVMDLFGSQRTKTFNPQTNGPFLRLKDGTQSKDLAIEVTACPDTVIAGDAARGKGREPFPPLETTFDCIIAVDIYQSGDSPTQEFSEAFALEMITSYSKTQTLYWVGRRFPGVAGGDDAIERDGKPYVEQVYVKDDRGFVCSSPDSVSMEYAPHPAPEWLFKRSGQYLDMAIKSKIGPYYVVALTYSSRLRQPICDMVLPPPHVDEIMLHTRVTRFFGFHVRNVARPVTVHVPTWIKLAPQSLNKIPNGQLLDIVTTRVQSEFAKIPWLNALLERQPGYFMRIQAGTIQAVLYHGRIENSRVFGDLRQNYKVYEEHLILARQVNNVFESPFMSVDLVKPAIAVLCALGAVMVQLKNNYYAGAWIFPRRPVLSAVMEECLAYVSDELALLGVVLEFLLNGGGAWATLLMHCVCALLRNYGVPGRLAAALVHVGWNFAARKRGNRRFAVFEKTYASGDILEVGENHVEEISDSITLPSYTTAITRGPDHFRGSIKVKVDGVSMGVEEALEALGRPVGKNVLYPILITNRLLFQPAKNETNLLAAILLRIHANPFALNPFTDEERHERWSELAHVFIGLLPMWRNAYCDVAMNIAAMKKKGARLERAFVDDNLGVCQYVGKTINLKWNETISATKVIDGVPTMKPRAIQNLPPLVHAMMGGFARTLNQTLHEIFDGRVHSVCDIPVRIFFASGYTQRELSGIAEAMASGATVIAVSGDDSAVSWGGLCHDFAGEADQSAFDHTQDAGPMLCFMRPFLQYLGFPDTFISQAFYACSSGYSVKTKRLSVKGEAGVQMPTGITTTTTFNSLSTLAMYVWMLKNIKRIGCDLVTAGRELGFTVKYSPSDRLDTVTFLKGWFQYDGSLYQWMPLPSAILKIGKLLRDPVEITSHRTNRRCVKSGRSEAIRMCATALAQSYGTVERSYPILGEFLYTMIRLGVVPKTPLRDVAESWKPDITGVTVSREHVLEAIFIRYGLDTRDVVNFEKLLGGIQSLPAYVESPLCDRLCEIDY